jgi:hypothetical protein
VALTDLVESVHRSISRGPGTPQDGPTSDLTGLIYQGVKNVIRLAGGGVDALLAQFGPMLGDAEPSRPRDAMLSALNGVVGDHLVATGSPLAIPIRLRMNGMPLRLKRRALAAEISRPSGRVAILVHCASTTGSGTGRGTITGLPWLATSATRRSISTTTPD